MIHSKKHDEGEKNNEEERPESQESQEEVLQKPESKEKTDKELAEEYLNDLKRCRADFENYKKRQENEREQMARFVTSGILSELIPILDNFNVAVAHVPEDKKNDPWVTGITYIEKQFEETLSRYGVKVMEVKAGEAFDPAKHEAVEHHEKEGAKNLIVEKVIQKGYLMGGKVVRAAKVTVTST